MEASRRSEQPSAVRHLLIRRNQHDVALLIRKAQGQNLRHEFPDLPRREVHDGGNLPPNQARRFIKLRDLHARSFGAKDWAEIDGQLERWLARLRKRLDRDDRPHPDIDGEELIEGDLRRGRRAGLRYLVHEKYSLKLRLCRPRPGHPDIEPAEPINRAANISVQDFVTGRSISAT